MKSSIQALSISRTKNHSRKFQTSTFLVIKTSQISNKQKKYILPAYTTKKKSYFLQTMMNSKKYSHMKKNIFLNTQKKIFFIMQRHFSLENRKKFSTYEES